MIYINGKKISTLMLNGKKISKMWQNGKLIYTSVRSCFSNGTWKQDNQWLDNETWN